MRLIYAMRCSANVEAMTQFYREHLGLTTAAESPAFVEFTTGPTSFALLAVSAGREPGFELCFAVDDIAAEVERLRARGAEFIDEVRAESFGKVIHMRDAEGVVSTLLQPAWPSAAKGEPELGAVILNAWDYGAAITFYRDRLGLTVLHETPHWMELETGGARLALHARAERPDVPGHGRQQVACAFDQEDLDAWHAAALDRGSPVATEPTDESFGRYAEVVDPDGHLVVFREPAFALAVPELMADAFEDDSPHTGGFRKPVRKTLRGAGRPGPRAEQRPREESAAQAHAARGAGVEEGVTVTANGGDSNSVAAQAAGVAGHRKPKSNMRLKSVRGGGEERTREYPRNRSDVKRARAKPGIGRAEKEKQRMLSQQKTTNAQMSKSRPVKHEASRIVPAHGASMQARTMGRSASRPAAPRPATRSDRRGTARAVAARGVSARTATSRGATTRSGSRTPSTRATPRVATARGATTRASTLATARGTKRTAARKTTQAAARGTKRSAAAGAKRTASRAASRTRTSSRAPARKGGRATRSGRSR